MLTNSEIRSEILLFSDAWVRLVIWKYSEVLAILYTCWVYLAINLPVCQTIAGVNTLTDSAWNFVFISLSSLLSVKKLIS